MPSARSYDLSKTTSAGILNVFKGSNGHTTVRLHSTRVLEINYNEKIVTLRTGGWLTDTTKKAINRGLDLIGCPASVFQKDFNWYVRSPKYEKPIQFNSGMIISFDGLVWESIDEYEAYMLPASMVS